MFGIAGELLGIISVFVLDTIKTLGYLGIFSLSALESANIPIPSEIILPFSGFLAAQETFNFWFVVLAGSFGNLSGAIVSYYLAVPLSKRLEHRGEFRTAQRWYKRFGEWSVFVGRLLPVVRTFISFPAGMFRVNILKFSLLTFVGSFIWSWFLTYIGFTLGENWNVIEPYFKKFDVVIVGVIGIGFAWWLWHHVRKRKPTR